MYHQLFRLCLLSGLALFTFSCGSDQATEENNTDQDDGINITYENDQGEEQSINIDLQEEDLQNLQNNLADAFEQASASLRENADGEQVEAMNFRDLKELLPTSLLGMDRTKHQGEKSGAMGFTISQAEAEYQEDDKRLKVQVVDAAQMGMAKLGMVAWTSIEVDKEGDFGYERTTMIDGNKAFEKWDAKTSKGELIILYNDRYIINLDGRNIDGDDLRKALKKIDLDDLE
jgi:gamma-glutamylcysteine synthetase